MTPLKVLVEGFLSYRDEQVAVFEGGAVWMLAGRNGAGKSSLFDAMTVALFQQHRDGAQNFDSLINTKCDAFRIEFDFALGEQRFQARCTRHRRKTTTFQMREWIAAPDGSGEGRWNDIPGAEGRDGFRAWVERNVGLSYEAFTSSVMLIQGRAENLIDAKPKERHTLLSQIVGADRFNDVLAQAIARRKAAANLVAAIHTRLEDVAEASLEKVLAAEESLADAQQALATAEAKVEASQRTLAQAEEWDRRRRKLAQLESDAHRNAELLAQATEIERDAARLTTLDERIPRLDAFLETQRRVVERRDQVARLTASLAEREAERSRADERLARLEAELSSSHEQLQTAQANERAADEQTRSVQAATATLQRWRRDATELAKRRDEAGAAERAESELHARIDAVRRAAPSGEALAAAQHAESESKETRDQTAALLKQAEQQKSSFASLKDAERCSTCRQPLTAEHRAEEEARLAAAVAELSDHFQSANAIWQTDAKRRRELTVQVEAAQSEAASLNQQLARVASRRAAAMEAAEQLEARCKAEFRALPAERRAEWPAEAAGGWLLALPRAEILFAEWQREASEAEARTLAEREQLAALKQEQTRLKSEQDRATKDRRADEQQTAQTRQELAAAQAALAGDERERQQAAQAISAESPSGDEQEIAGLRREWSAERETLRKSDAPGRLARLREAQAHGAQLAADRRALLNEQDSVPTEARRDPAAVERERAAAVAERETARRALSLSEAERQRLVAMLAKKERLATESLAADLQLRRLETLERLLGRDGLQRWLVRRAEATIVEYADEILNGFSAGELRVQLRKIADEEKEEAFQLEVRTPTSESPLDPKYLSGSQKFRLAVSMALAVGRFASRTRRPIKSVVIDEGFGCLDEPNRQAVIEQLRSLQTQLDRIILVSHQEEFYNAFPEGCHCEMVDGATKLSVRGR
ncbi:MAG TPA: SMC family ATPase [Pirellulales bacterium]